ncbi:glycerate kinase [Brevibacillus panacihumi]|uniref:glycerate kinase n=1 Tax=Brevibacillus panacihumi TaxID=497735 RepID=UPI003D020CD0
MKIVIAPDSFKGSATALQAAQSIEAGVKARNVALGRAGSRRDRNPSARSGGGMGGAFRAFFLVR